MTRAAHPPETARLHVEELGTEGDVLLLLHGFGATGFTWRHWAPELARDYRVLVADLKGFGNSPKPRNGYSPFDQADAVCRLLDDLGIERVTLVGHSLGGGVALLTAIKMLQAGRLDRVKALVLVSSAAMPQSLPFFIRLARIRALNIVALGRVPPRHVVRWILRQIVYERETISDEMVEGYAGPLAVPASRRALLDTARQIIPDNVHDIVAEYPALNVPVLLLWGEHDKVVPLWVGEQLSGVLPNAELVVLPRCGHVPPEERPMVSLQTVNAFLAKAGDAPAPE